MLVIFLKKLKRMSTTIRVSSAFQNSIEKKKCSSLTTVSSKNSLDDTCSFRQFNLIGRLKIIMSVYIRHICISKFSSKLKRVLTRELVK